MYTCIHSVNGVGIYEMHNVCKRGKYAFCLYISSAYAIQSVSS